MSAESPALRLRVYPVTGPCYLSRCPFSCCTGEPDDMTAPDIYQCWLGLGVEVDNNGGSLEDVEKPDAWVEPRAGCPGCEGGEYDWTMPNSTTVGTPRCGGLQEVGRELLETDQFPPDGGGPLRERP